eukprot:NODE_24165_length_636_cov_2.345776.p3 GENE.NODE_24165_length_636_cov_2.345776~~NODE_24165_length_636_cov_2.345776.p3  ORF type:complete len:68 (-),score=5.65 NODE_24165_length_636_cov_2.345776:148-351(-)
MHTPRAVPMGHQQRPAANICGWHASLHQASQTLQGPQASRKATTQNTQRYMRNVRTMDQPVPQPVPN